MSTAKRVWGSQCFNESNYSFENTQSQIAGNFLSMLPLEPANDLLWAESCAWDMASPPWPSYHTRGKTCRILLSALTAGVKDPFAM